MNLAIIFEGDKEEDIDQMISDAKIHEHNHGMAQISADEPILLQPILRLVRTRKPLGTLYQGSWQNNVLERKRRNVRDLLTSLNRLSASLLAAISVAERQIAILQDLHNLFLTRDQEKNKAHVRGSPLRQTPSFKDVAPTPISSENPEQLCPGDLVAIDQVVRERKSFIKKIKVLVENMGVRRETV